jgi:hypothetical protein
MATAVNNNQDIISQYQQMSSKQTAQSIFNGSFDDMQNLSIKDRIELTPAVRLAREKLDKVNAEMEENTEIAESLDVLGTKLKAFVDRVDVFSNPIDSKDDVFKRKNAIISSTDIQAQYVDVDVATESNVGDFQISVKTLAKEHEFFFGTEKVSTGDPNVVNTVIQNLAHVTLNDIKTAIEGAAVDKVGVVPSNPLAYSLYSMVLSAINKSTPIATLRADSLAAYNDMLVKDISEGYSSLSAEVVSAVDTKFNSGNYVFQSLPGERIVANRILEDVNLAGDIISRLAAIADVTTPSKTAILDAIDTPPIAGMTYVSRLPDPEKHPLAYAIAHAAWDGADGIKTMLELKTLASAIETSPALFHTHLSKNRDMYPENSEEWSNKFAKYVLDKIHSKIGSSGMTFLTLKAEVEASYLDYLEKCKVTLENGNTLQDVIDKINATTEFSGVTATTIELASGNLLLTVASKNSGSKHSIKAYSYPAPTLLFSAAPISMSSGFANNAQTQSAETLGNDSVCMIDGLPVVRSSNKFEYSKGTLISLLKENTTGEYQSIHIEPEYEEIIPQMQLLVKEFNELSNYLAEQSTRDQYTGLYLEDAKLGKSETARILKNMLSIITTFFSSSGISLRDVGIKTEDKRTENGKASYLGLNLDPYVLLTELKKDSARVEKLFGKTQTSTNTAMRISNFSDVYNKNYVKFKVQIDTTNSLGPDTNRGAKIQIVDELGNPIGEPEYHLLSGTAGNYKVDLRNMKESKLYGLDISYKSSISTSTDVEMAVNYGFAANAYGLLNAYSDDSTKARIGKISSEILNIYQINTDLQREKIDKEQNLETNISFAENKIGNSMSKSQKAQFDAKVLDAYIKAQDSTNQ